jgi:NAD+ kinase
MTGRTDESARAAQVEVVLKRSSWRKWVEQEADPRIAELLAAGDETVGRMRASHTDHMETIEEVRASLDELGAVARYSDTPHDFHVDPRSDLVVIVGGDGTLLGASHGVGPGVPILGVNSSPDYSVGFFCGAKKGQVKQAIAAALEGKLRRSELTRMRVELNGRALHDRVLNEALFCHVSPAATSRYILRVIGSSGQVLGREDQKSSGVWVGPAAGSTGAQRSAGGQTLPLTSSHLQYVVREPYRPQGEELTMVIGLVGEGECLALKSKMRSSSIFLDGYQIVHHVGIGDVVTMRRSTEPLVVLGLSRNGSG